MIVVPIKWLPWLFIIGGIGLLVDGETVTGLVALVLGGVWIFLRGQKKNKLEGSISNNRPSQTTSTPTKTAAAQAAQTTQSGQCPIFCTVCGTRSDSGAIFCANCGTKLTK